MMKVQLPLRPLVVLLLCCNLLSTRLVPAPLYGRVDAALASPLLRSSAHFVQVSQPLSADRSMTAGIEARAAIEPALPLSVSLSAPVTATLAYTITDLGTLLGFSHSTAQAINEAGQVVGYAEPDVYTEEGAGRRAFLWENGTMHDLGALGGKDSRAVAINEAGQVIGSADTAEGESHAFLWENGTMHDLGDLYAVDINEAGQVVGQASIFIPPGGSRSRAVLWEKGTLHDLGTLGGDYYSRSVAINEAGQVIGNSGGPPGVPGGSRTHAFLWENGTMHDLGTLGGRDSGAQAINEAGQVVGTSRTAEGSYHAFLWEDGTMHDLGTLGGNESRAYAINEAGQVVGSSITAAGEYHAFLWENGTMHDIGPLSFFSNAADIINEAGQVIGMSQTAAGENHAFLWENGTMHDLGNLGGNYTYAVAINEAGQVVGMSRTAAGEAHAVLFNPVAPPLVFIPGMAGSELVDQSSGKKLWFATDFSDRRALSLRSEDATGRDVIATDALRKATVGPVTLAEIYAPLLDSLTGEGDYVEYQVDGDPLRRTTEGCDDENQRENRPTLFVFAYDWRLSNTENAARLQDYIGCVQKFYPDSQVDLLAHSNGNLVARRYILNSYDPADPNEGHQVRRFISIAAPWLGGPKAIYTLETGHFIPFVAGSKDLKYALESMPGPHQLIPSPLYTNEAAVIPPLVERGWDLNGNGIRYEDYTDSDIRTVLDARYPAFLPGTVGKDFHDYTQPWGGQDDWSGDQTSVEYHQIYGIQGAARTIGQVQVKEGIVCSLASSLRICRWGPTYRTQKVVGDGTVPLASAQLEAPNVRLYPFYGSTDGGDELVEHNGLLRNPRVHDQIRQLLQSQLSTPTGSARAAAEAAESPAHYLFIDGAENVVVEDSTGASTAPLQGDLVGTVAGATVATSCDSTSEITLAVGNTYMVSFQTSQHPLTLEIVTGTPLAIEQAIRYLDATMPPGVRVQLAITPEEIRLLHYDGDDNGTFETPVSPLVQVSGAAAQDQEAPVVTVTATEYDDGAIVVLTAQDADAGVKNLYYSLDGSHFTLYSEPFQVNPSLTPIIYAFSDDQVANRSDMVEYVLDEAAALGVGSANRSVGSLCFTPPITSLESAPGPNSGEAVLQWVAPSPPDGTLYAAYELRYSRSPINEATWPAATLANDLPDPAAGGTSQAVTIPDLTTGVRWYFAIKVRDTNGTWSSISNVPSLLDSGFRPRPDGYSFSNYGDVEQADLTTDDLRRLFGDNAVCQQVQPQCIERPAARQWRQQTLNRMTRGHCEGMSVTSLRFFLGEDSQPDFQLGAATTFELQKPNIRRHIAYYHSFQYTPGVRADKNLAVLNPPSATLDQLLNHFSSSMPDLVNMFVRNPIGGHSISPYAVEQVNDLEWRVWLYDNNRPTQARSLRIDTGTNTWRYNLGGNLGEWTGDATSWPSQRRGLGIISVSRYAGMQPCPWCSPTVAVSDRTGADMGEVWLTGGGHLLIRDEQNRRLGYSEDGFVDEIPGADAYFLDGGLGIPLEPIYSIPLSTTYTILLDGQTLTKTQTASLTQFGPGYAVGIDGIPLEPGDQDRLQIAADGTVLGYQAGSRKAITLTLILEDGSADYQFQLAGADLAAGQAVSATVDAVNGRLHFDNSGGVSGLFDLALERVSAEGVQTFKRHGIEIDAGDIHGIDFSTWKEDSTLILEIDRGGDGSIDETIPLVSGGEGIFLPLINR